MSSEKQQHAQTVTASSEPLNNHGRDNNPTQKRLPWSQTTRESPAFKKSLSLATHSQDCIAKKTFIFEDTADSHGSKSSCNYIYLNEDDSEGEGLSIAVSKDLMYRLEETCESEEENVRNHIRLYLFRRYRELSSMQFPYISPPSFFVLCRTVCDVSFEFFVDPLSVSGILPNYCSFEANYPGDRDFGSSGEWGDLEAKPVGAAGVPLFRENLLESILTSCETRVRRKTPFCRVYILPYNSDGPLAKRVDRKIEDDFHGHVVAVMMPDVFNFSHRRELFELISEENCADFRPLVKTAMVIWINESYRNLHSVPLDVEECFGIWAVEALSSTSALRYDAINSAFPTDSRSGDERAQDFAVLF